jgi:hypothetical protein
LFIPKAFFPTLRGQRIEFLCSTKIGVQGIKGGNRLPKIGDGDELKESSNPRISQHLKIC